MSRKTNSPATCRSRWCSARSIPDSPCPASRRPDMQTTFDRIEVGAEYHSAGRTVTEADIVNFAGVTGDFNALHMDDQWVATNTPYPGRIAHGLLVHAMGEGLRCAELDS